ncbi:AQR1 [Symbiodinium natans]|uniref:AQR1 protein n=1 Tax=Symbiodinium natans TaxID=878477 RepID=A0A812J0G9_9DINO|nr:AQR1 [Symbiodinium natans]
MMHRSLFATSVRTNLDNVKQSHCSLVPRICLRLLREGALLGFCFDARKQKLCGYSLHARSFRAYCGEDGKKQGARGSAAALKEQIAQLRKDLHATPWKTLSRVLVENDVLQLPWKGPDWKTLPEPSPEEMSYMAGFFDGDGCVTEKSNLSGCRLAVSQAFDASAVLVRYANLFGGTVEVRSQGVGLQKPVLNWRLEGPGCKHVSNLLATASVVKHKQLALAAKWPKDTDGRKLAKHKLRGWKHGSTDTQTHGCVSWSYFAGFFDAEGCIKITTTGNLMLTICQKREAILNVIKVFLADQSIHSELYNCRTHGCLSIHRRGDCEAVLQRMQHAGLLVKAQHAEIALNTEKTGPSRAREQLGLLVGNQSFGKRLDEAGCLRAQEIRRMRQQVWYLKSRGQEDAAAARLLAAQELVAKHDLLKLKAERDMLLRHAAFIQRLSGSMWE